MNITLCLSIFVTLMSILVFAEIVKDVHVIDCNVTVELQTKIYENRSHEYCYKLKALGEFKAFSTRELQIYLKLNDYCDSSSSFYEKCVASKDEIQKLNLNNKCVAGKHGIYLESLTKACPGIVDSDVDLWIFRCIICIYMSILFIPLDIIKHLILLYYSGSLIWMIRHYDFSREEVLT